MNIKVSFETDSDKDSFYDDKKDMEEMLKLKEYQMAMCGIEQELIDLVKNQMASVESKGELFILIDNFYDRFFKHVKNLNYRD